MAREKVDNKLNVVVGTKAQIEGDASIPENSIIVITDEKLKADEIVYIDGKNVKEAIADLEAGTADIVDNLNTDDATKVLSAKQGKVLQDKKVDKLLTIIGLNLEDNILIGEFRTALGNATQSVAGLLSAEDKTHLDGLVALLETSDGNNVVDTIGEVLAIFNSYPEGADLVTALAGKVDKVEGKGLSTNDLTDALKSNYDTAYGWGDHAIEGYLKEITKAMVEAVLTGTITSHDHDDTYEPADANIQSHISSTSNPHGVTKEQVGLGSVLDYDIATQAEAEAGTSNEKYMTPLRTKEAILELSPPTDTSALEAHMESTSNPHGVTKAQVGLGDVDNTSDLDKPISTAQQTALDNKVDKVEGKGLSTEDYTTTEKNKLSGIEEGAEVNVQSNWTQEVDTADDYIKNKPVIPTKVSDLTNDSEFITTETDPIFTAWDKSTGISITKSQVSDLIEATQALSGLMSATDKQRLDVLHALLGDTEDADIVVNTINEILAIFNSYPEGADLVTALAGKVDKVEGKGLSTNDLTDALKSNYDTAYGWGDHAIEGYLKEITKEDITDFAHTHGNITTDGKIGAEANLIVQTGTDGLLTAKPKGNSSQYLRGDGTWAIPNNYEVFTSVKSGLVPAPYDYGSTYFLRQDATWAVPETTDINGVTASAAEINCLDGVESNIQTQLDGKQNALTAGDGISISGNVISATGVNLDDYYTKSEIDSMIGNIETALDAILGV